MEEVRCNMGPQLVLCDAMFFACDSTVTSSLRQQICICTRQIKLPNSFLGCPARQAEGKLKASRWQAGHAAVHGRSQALRQLCGVSAPKRLQGLINKSRVDLNGQKVSLVSLNLRLNHSR